MGGAYKVAAQPAGHQGEIAPLRVVIVGPSLRRLIGGQEVQAALLVRHWQEDRAVKITFVPSNMEPPDWLSGVERIRGLRTLVRMPFFLAALFKAVRDCDVVHAFSASHSSFLLAPMPAWLIARLLDKRVLINYHSGRAGEHLKDSVVARMVLKHTDGIVVPSNYLISVFREYGIQALAVPNLVDPTQFFYRPRVPLRPWLLCTRNFQHYYGVDLVVRAFSRVKQAFSDARLILVGQGKAEPLIRRLVSELELRDVVFTGPISRDKIGEVCGNADIFINGSRIDNAPVSILESFASGLPVVTTAAGGIPYIVTHERTGLLCDVGDWKGLADNTIRLLKNQDLALLLSQNARQESLLYGWNVVREGWLDTYQSLMRHRPAPGRFSHGPQNLDSST